MKGVAIYNIKNTGRKQDMENKLTSEGKTQAIYMLDKFAKPKSSYDKGRIPVDMWEPNNENEVIINCIPGFFVAPISIIYDVGVNPDDKLNYFMLSTKKCYNSAAMRQHLYQYVNYFCNYYDYTREYLAVLFVMKTKMDRYDASTYTVEMFFNDIERYILRSNIVKGVTEMVNDNYYQELNYTNIKSPYLQYTNDHAKLLHKMSILMDLCIPLLTNYAYMHKVDNIDDYLLALYDRILSIEPSVNIYKKLYETAYTNVNANQKNNQGIWVKQDIRAIDITTHSTDSVHNIILNIMPKYTFDKNIISFNYASIRKNTSYKITDISFEYSYVPISSSKRDNDSISDFDKFESNLIRMNEGLYLQNKINGEVCMRNIETLFGPFDPVEIEHYTKRIITDENGNYTIDSFQKQLIFSMFYRYFRDTQSIHAINREDYIKLIIAAKKLLRSNNMIILPYIISGKVEKLVSRKSVNKKEKALVEASPSFPRILEKYKNEDITNHILSIIATIISSDFSIVDMDPNIDGKRLDTVNIAAIIEEVELFILMC